MEDRENSSLLSGFRCEPIRELDEWFLDNEEARYMEEVQMGNKILMCCEFEPWEEFDTLVSTTASKLSESIREQGCHDGNQKFGYCRGEFRNDVCHNDGCSGMAYYKGRMKKRPEARYEYVRPGISVHVLRNLLALANQMHQKKFMLARPFGGPVVNTQAIHPNLGFVQITEGYDNPIPDVIIDLFSPNRLSLLPQQGNPTNLASAYAQSCGTVKECATLLFHQRCMAQAIKSALFTRSGFGCLFNHNQAVFVKVCPNVEEGRDPTKVGHKVFVSREFKCDGDISAFHGLLTLVIYGMEASNDGTKKSLREYFRLLEALERFERGELIVHRSFQEGRKRRAAEALDAGECGESGCKSERDVCFADFYPVASKKAQEKVRDAVGGGKFAELSELDMIRMFITRSKVLAIGNIGTSGIILESEVEGMKVVVKRWNRKSDCGLAWFLREILVYKKLRELNPDVVGSVVPRLIAVSESSPKESVLVTEFVGSMPNLVLPDEAEREKTKKTEDERENRRNDEGEWYVDGVKLSEGDKREIERSAVEGLRRLHKCGIIHRDLRPMNLRVERVSEEDGTMRWRTWWIDLGYVKVLDEEKFGDQTFIRSIFHDAEAFGFEWNEYEPVFRLGEEM